MPFSSRDAAKPGSDPRTSRRPTSPAPAAPEPAHDLSVAPQAGAPGAAVSPAAPEPQSGAPAPGAPRPAPPPAQPGEMYIDWGPDLPESYGHDELHLMAQDPYTLFCYWALDGEGSRAARQAHPEVFHGGGALRLRVHNLTFGVFTDHDIHPAQTSGYYPATPFTRFRAEIGFDTGGAWHSLMSSEAVLSPNASVSGLADAVHPPTPAESRHVRRLVGDAFIGPIPPPEAVVPDFFGRLAEIPRAPRFDRPALPPPAFKEGTGPAAPAPAAGWWGADAGRDVAQTPAAAPGGWLAPGGEIGAPEMWLEDAPASRVVPTADGFAPEGARPYRWVEGAAGETPRFFEWAPAGGGGGEGMEWVEVPISREMVAEYLEQMPPEITAAFEQGQLQFGWGDAEGIPYVEVLGPEIYALAETTFGSRWLLASGVRSLVRSGAWRRPWVSSLSSPRRPFSARERRPWSGVWLRRPASRAGFSPVKRAASG